MRIGKEILDKVQEGRVLDLSYYRGGGFQLRLVPKDPKDPICVFMDPDPEALVERLTLALKWRES